MGAYLWISCVRKRWEYSSWDILVSTWRDPWIRGKYSEPSMAKNFKGKKVFLASSSGETDFTKTTLGLEVIKGSVAAALGDSPKAASAVDGISGATLTCNGVTEAFANSLAPYRPLLTFFADLNSSGESHDNQ